MEEHKINILMLTDCLSTLAGGAEKQIVELAKGLSRSRYDVRVVSLECDGPTPDEMKTQMGCPVYSFPVKRVYGISGLVQGIKFFKFLKRERIDILQTYHFSSDIWGTLIGHWAKVPVIISNRRDMGFWKTKRHQWAYKWINQWVQKVVVVCDALKRIVVNEEGLSENRVQVIYNGIDVNAKDSLEQAQRFKSEIDVNGEHCVIMHVANLNPVKGHKYLLEAVSKIVSDNDRVKLVLIGQDNLNGELNQLVRTLNIENNTYFAGKRDNARNLLSIADICVLPSLSEGNSNALLEYMAAGKPVVTTNVGGNPELIEQGVNGLLVDKANEEQLRAALSVLINDKKQRQLMGEKGLKRVKNDFSIDAMVDRYDRLFQGLVS